MKLKKFDLTRTLLLRRGEDADADGLKAIGILLRTDKTLMRKVGAGVETCVFWPRVLWARKQDISSGGEWELLEEEGC